MLGTVVEGLLVLMKFGLGYGSGWVVLAELGESAKREC